jgi:hypothetical protein
VFPLFYPLAPSKFFPTECCFIVRFKPGLYGVQGLTSVHSGFQQEFSLILLPVVEEFLLLFSTCTFWTASTSAQEKGEKRVSVFVVRSANGCLTHHSCCRTFLVGPFSQISYQQLCENCNHSYRRKRGYNLHLLRCHLSQRTCSVSPLPNICSHTVHFHSTRTFATIVVVHILFAGHQVLAICTPFPELRLLSVAARSPVSKATGDHQRF